MSIILLDLDSVEIIGWEKRKSKQVIDSIIHGILAGDKFPPVPVHKVKWDVYQLIYGTNGGHNRALGHYLAHAPLRCDIKSTGSLLEYEDDEPLFIRNIEIVDNIHAYFTRKRAYPKYR